MSACTLRSESLLSANDLFKLRYNRYLRWAALVAVLATLAIFFLSPRYTPAPYTLRQTVIEIIPFPEAIELPEEVLPAPTIPQIVEPVDDPAFMEDDIDWDAFLLPDEPLRDPGEIGTGNRGSKFRVSYTKPQLVFCPQPYYPEIARLSRIEGTVTVEVRVGKNGLIKETRIAQGAHPLLNRAAVDAARRCRFSPGMQREMPVAVWMALPFRFRLD